MNLRGSLFSSLRSRILALVIAGGVLPLALVGWWLSQATPASVERRLRLQLDSSLTAAVEVMERRWFWIAADMHLLTPTAVMEHLFAAPSSTLTGVDSAYLESVPGELRDRIASATYRDRAGEVRWAFGRILRDAGWGSSDQDRFVPIEPPGYELVRAVKASDGTEIGEVTIRVHYGAILSQDSARTMVAGATLSLHDQRTGEQLSGLPSPASAAEWIVVSRTLKGVPLTAIARSPTSVYLQPFRAAARIGLWSLALVVLIAVALSAYFAARVTRPLEQLVHAADAVAAGDLKRTVGAPGSRDEVGRLAGAFNTMTESLRSTMDRLAQQESLAAVGEFAASLSHEVRNALTSVGVDIQRAQEKSDDRAASGELLHRARGNVRRLDAVVTGALRVARSGHTPMEPVDIVAALRDAIQLAEPATAQSTIVELAVPDEPDQPLFVMGDRIALEQLFVNVLINAGQAIAATGRVRIRVESDADFVIVTIVDNGRGISQRDLERIGTNFYSRRPGGNGLGLAIAQRIAIAHNGKLTIDSVLHSGTTVSIKLLRATTADMPHSNSK